MPEVRIAVDEGDIETLPDWLSKESQLRTVWERSDGPALGDATQDR
jgi:hypothetical protein